MTSLRPLFITTALPFANGWAAQEINVAVFFIVAVLGLEVFGVILAGYASGSKWSLFGGMREAAQVVSYEVPIGMCVVIPVMIVGSMNLVTIGEAQAGLFSNWLIFHDPFTFLVFWVYFTCAVASVTPGRNRANSLRYVPKRSARSSSRMPHGSHSAPRDGSSNPCGMTPTTVTGRPSSVSFDPTIFGSPPRRCRQNPSSTITTGAAFG